MIGVCDPRCATAPRDSTNVSVRTQRTARAHTYKLPLRLCRVTLLVLYFDTTRILTDKAKNFIIAILTHFVIITEQYQ